MHRFRSIEATTELQPTDEPFAVAMIAVAALRNYPDAFDALG